MKKALRWTVTILFFLVAAEIAARILTSFHVVYDVEMTRYALELKMNSSDTLIGHVHRPNARARLMGVDVAINSAGFRGREYAREKSGARRIVLLGDSLTFGWGVPQDKTFAAVLERALDGQGETEVLNFGTGNYNAEQSVELFLKQGALYAPDDVVLCYFINDAEIAKPRSKLWFLGHSRLISLVWSRILAIGAQLNRSRGFLAYYRSLYSDGAPGWLRAQRAILRLKEFCAQRGIRLSVALLPELHTLKGSSLQGEYDAVRAFLRQNGIPFVDVTESFRDFSDPYQFWVARDDAHPNARAHALIAQSLLSGLFREHR